ncbi:hypothetical protein ILYODFUR_030331 [Ilyodon furcidens]|uniref:Uncharacterized protein n=1 Tax=Ilyodon furcidens TaxID=33524 RepID=A0ABV0TYZ5_9TELE
MKPVCVFIDGRRCGLKHLLQLCHVLCKINTHHRTSCPLKTVTTLPFELGMGSKFTTFVGTDQIPSVLPSTCSRNIKQDHVSVPKSIIVTLRDTEEEWLIFPCQT